jgi:tryptophan halogenase
MQDQVVKKVVIAGGGTAGWMAAAALAKQLGPLLDISLVESDEIGTVGVGESTIPTARTFNALLGIDEPAFMRATQATFKLGISFEHWARIGDRYIHSFGQVGKSNWMGSFHHFWLAAKAAGFGGDLGDYCFELKAAEADKFSVGEGAELNYAYHLDATLYGGFLRRMSEGLGVRRIEGKISQVQQRPRRASSRPWSWRTATGHRGRPVHRLHGLPGPADRADPEGGLRGLGSLAADQQRPGRADPVHRPGRALYPRHRPPGGLALEDPAAAPGRQRPGLLRRVHVGRPGPRDPAGGAGRRAADRAAGHPLSHRPAAQDLVQELRRPGPGQRLRRAAGIDLDPPDHDRRDPADAAVPVRRRQRRRVARYNQQAVDELEKIRDFIILHYKLTERTDSPFWDRCRTMDIPDSLAQRIDLFRESAQAFQAPGELFQVDSWLQVMLGQRLEPAAHHQMGRLMPPEQLRGALADLSANIARAVGGLPSHQAFLDRYCGVEAS